MNKHSFKTRIKLWIAGIGFRLFIWGNETSPEDYWTEIYEQEKLYHELKHFGHAEGRSL